MSIERTQNYIIEVARRQKQAEACEHAYRPLLENLLRVLPSDKYSVINDPAKVGHNAPDFLIKKREVLKRNRMKINSLAEIKHLSHDFVCLSF
jgi:hypothetical protein